MSFRFSKTIRAGSREVKMKKMMLGLAASLCVAVTFADGVESANVVGYKTIRGGEKGGFTRVFEVF